MPTKRDRIHVQTHIDGGWIARFNGCVEPLTPVSDRAGALRAALLHQTDQPIYLHNPDGTVHCVIQPE